MGSRTLIIALVLPLLPAVGSARDTVTLAPPAEHFGVGVFGAAGTSTIGAVRVSVPVGDKAGCDLDIGRGSSPADPDRTFGLQVRYLRRGRSANGGSGYWIFGILRVNETVRYRASAGREIWEVVEHKSATMPQIGYGWDWQGRRGTRLGLELTTGSEGEAGPRFFAKLFVVWGPPLKP